MTLEPGLLADLGRGEDLGHHRPGLGGFMHARARVKAHGLEAFGSELLGKLRILLRLSHVHVALQVIVARVTQRGDHFLDVELLLVPFGVLAPAVDVRADQCLLHRGARAVRRPAEGKGRYRRAQCHCGTKVPEELTS